METNTDTTKTVVPDAKENVQTPIVSEKPVKVEKDADDTPWPMPTEPIVASDDTKSPEPVSTTEEDKTSNVPDKTSLLAPLLANKILTDSEIQLSDYVNSKMEESKKLPMAAKLAVMKDIIEKLETFVEDPKAPHKCVWSGLLKVARLAEMAGEEALKTEQQKQLKRDTLRLMDWASIGLVLSAWFFLVSAIVLPALQAPYMSAVGCGLAGTLTAIMSAVLVPLLQREAFRMRMEDLI